MFSFINHGCHVATITISADLVYLVISLVLLLQLITVAHAFIRRQVIGFQTILLLQIIHISFQIILIFSDFKISIIQAGVHGTNQESSHINIFH
jgi:hypothetical protein